MRFAFIDAWKEVWPVGFLCGVMQVTARGFRAWRVRPMSQRQRDDMVILAHIREQHRLSLQSYGRPRMTGELQEPGLNVGHRRVGYLMRASGIKIVRTRKYKATADSNHAFNIAPNLLDQDFSTNGPDQKWAGDISCIRTGDGWLYLAVILDLYSRRVIGWAVGNRMKRDLAIRALVQTDRFGKFPREIAKKQLTCETASHILLPNRNQVLKEQSHECCQRHQTSRRPQGS